MNQREYPRGGEPMLVGDIIRDLISGGYILGGMDENRRKQYAEK